MYELEPAEFGSGEEWDAEITRFDLWHLYHTAAWLDFIEQTQPVERRVYRILEGDNLVGFLPGFALKKGPLRIFGSPLPGWTTAYLGPVVNRDVDQEVLFRSIARALKRDGFAHAEIRHNLLNPNAAVRAGFRRYAYETHLATVAGDPEAILASFTKEGRRNVRLAERAGLRAVVATEPEFADLYYEQLRAVFAKRNLEPTYPRERVHRLWRLLMPTGRLICVKVMNDERCLATGVDLVGNGWLHSFGSAASQEPTDLKCYPNELRRYFAFCEAARRGLTHYDLTGVRPYKRKFGAQLVDLPVLMRSSPLLRLAREAMRRTHALRQRLRRVPANGGQEGEG